MESDVVSQGKKLREHKKMQTMEKVRIENATVNANYNSTLHSKKV